MTVTTSTPWHKESFDRFLHDELPQLLAARIPLVGYRVDSIEPPTCRVEVIVAVAGREANVVFDALPYPDDLGIVVIGGQRRIVVPVADSQDLAEAEIACVGEQLRAYLAARLGQAPENVGWDEALIKVWLPLNAWIQAFFETQPTVERLDETNWLAMQTQLRRLRVPHSDQAIDPSYYGRICPIETPEGAEAGRLLTIATGATIRAGRLVVLDDRPEQILGVTARMVPFLEHSTVARLLMGVSMMHEWLEPPDPEPALVQTGDEPPLPTFWCGRNLLTAFISWGADTFEDALVISESCARRLAYPYPVEPGDKLSNRHGTKGVVSRIVPDAEMPHLPDGQAVEIIYHFTGLISRLNFGQVREALMGRIAHADNAPAIVPPFHAPSADDLRAACTRVGLNPDGMETLTIGRGGQSLPQRSMVGWVYWGRTGRTARAALRTATTGSEGQYQGEFAYVELRDAGAFENIREHWNTRAAEGPAAAELARRVAAGPIEQAAPPAPQFTALTSRLAAAGIRAELLPPDAHLQLRLHAPSGDVLTLAMPLLHPWLRAWSTTGWSPSYQLTRIGAWPGLPEYDAVVEANRKMERLLAVQAPESLRQKALADLDTGVSAYFDALVQPAQLLFGAQVLFSGRAVIAPGPDLNLDQVGLPDEIAWTLFGPLVTRELGDVGAVEARSSAAAAALDRIMARSWVVIYHGGGIDAFYAAVDASFLAFHPVRVAERVVRLHTQVCNLMNADFDGDEVEVFLPLTDAAQAEAGARLSVAALIARSPQLLKGLTPSQLAIWGLASLSMAPGGRDEIARLAGTDVAAPNGFVDKQSVAQAIQEIYRRDGLGAAAAASERLARRGFEASRASGTSMSPFFGESFTPPPAPESDDPATWYAYTGEVLERVRERAEASARTQFSDPDLGPQLLSAWSGARGNMHLIAQHIAPVGLMAVTGKFLPTIVRHSYTEGLTPSELFAVAVGYWMAWAETGPFADQVHPEAHWVSGAEGFKVLARARRSPSPGIVFARAATTFDDDPLTNVDSRLFVGLPVTAKA